jgi:hypothetical protein
VPDQAERGSRVAVGAEVYTSDGERLGTVKEIREPYFKVDIHLHPDVWLQMEMVRSFEQNKVTLEFPRASLNDYRVREPDFDRTPAEAEQDAEIGSAERPSSS